jgi:homogentisate 1,2-dioxygenase
MPCLKSPKILMTQEVKSKDESTAHYKLQNFEVLVATAAWYDNLLAMNTEGNTLQSNNLQLHLALTQIEGLINFLQQYR